MKYIEFGQGKSKVSNVVLGLMRIPELGNGEKVASLVNVALDNGINMVDIADCYTKGKAETLLGDAFAYDKSLRNKIYLQSKCGIVKDPFYYFDFSKKHILDAVDASLKRLKTDHLDSLLLHRPDALMDPEEICEAFCTLRSSGKVREFGVSNFSPSQMKLLQSELDVPLCADQVQMSICHTVMIDAGFNVNMDNEASVMHDGGVLEHCRMHDMAIQAWSVMQHGLFKGVFIGDPHYLKLNAALDKIAQKYGVSATAVAIAWVLRYPGKMQAVIGTTKEKRVADSAKASEIKLSREEWYELYLAAGNDLP